MEDIWDDDQFQEALDWWEDGDSYTTIRQKLHERGLSEDRIKYFIRMIDEYALDAAFVKQTRRNNKVYMILGIIVSLVGIGLSWNAAPFSVFKYITYGAILAGITIAWLNYRNYKSLDPEIRERRIRFESIKKKPKR